MGEGALDQAVDHHEPFFRPWRGRDYVNIGLLVMSESAYGWEDDEGWKSPSADHPTVTVHAVINNFSSEGSLVRRDSGEPSIFRREATRALAGSVHPSRSELIAAWDRCAYSIYVQSSVGNGSDNRPSRAMYEAAQAPFLSLLETLRPRRVVILGLEAWESFPPTQRYLTRDVQAYQLSSGDLVWCIALGHPASLQKWPGWETVHTAINLFSDLQLPAA
ncbi:MAG: Uncharacterized protein JWL84_6090 [Rhodospirillales bacterium]|jgi:hypothetical protein|nr:Uncharacterized protein [Rhodospirillales bacterium]